MFCLDDIGENVTSYGYHIMKLTQYGIGNCSRQDCFVNPNSITDVCKI